MKVRDEGFVRNKAVHIALGVRADGTKEILGLWLEQSSREDETVRGTVSPENGAKFWLRVMTEMKNTIVGKTIHCRGLPHLQTLHRSV